MGIYDTLMGKSRNKDGGAGKAPEGGKEGGNPTLENENSVSGLIKEVATGGLTGAMFPDLTNAAWDAFGEPLFAAGASAAGLSEMKEDAPGADGEGGEHAQGSGGVAAAEGDGGEEPVSAEVAAEVPPAFYTVAAGDTCAKIGEKVAAGGAEWSLAALQESTGMTVEQLGQLEVGQQLAIPPEWAAPLGVAPPPSVLAQVMVLLAEEGDADAAALAALWEQLSSDEKAGLQGNADVKEELQRVLRLGGPDEVQGYLDIAMGGITALDEMEQAYNPMRWARDAAAKGVVDAGRRMANLGFDWWSGEASTEEGSVPEEVVDPRRLLHEEHLEAGRTDVAAEALRLKDTSDRSHADDVGRSQEASQIWDALRDGRIDTLDAIKCSEFTSAAMAAAGYDLSQRWIDPETGLELAYADRVRGTGADCSTFVEVWMITGLLTEATHALIASQSGGAERVTAGSDRAAELHLADHGSDFLYVGVGSFFKKDIEEDHHFGAGAAVLAFGGEIVELNDRRPGDVQQWIVTRDGRTYGGNGHSSIVHAMKGNEAVIFVGASNSPTLHGVDVSEIGPGWVSITSSSGVIVEIGPSTDPATVASFSSTDVQLVDANLSGSMDATGNSRGADATEVGNFRASETGDLSEDNHVVSTGRLPSSPWFGWTPTNPDGVVAINSQAGDDV